MQYLSGILSFGVPCNRDSVGTFLLNKRDWLDDSLYVLRDSENSPFKNVGIEENKIVPYHEYTVVNVADHVRAYMDMLYDGEFEKLKGLFYRYIKCPRCRMDIFMMTYGKLRNLAEFSDINRFMVDEFGNAWMSYIHSVDNVATHMANHQEHINKVMATPDATKIIKDIGMGYSFGGLKNAKPVSTEPSTNISRNT